MYLAGEQPAYTEALACELRALPAKWLKDLAPASRLHIERSEDLAAELDAEHVYWIEAGTVQVSMNDRPLFHLQPGDLLGLAAPAKALHCRYRAASPLKLQAYPRASVQTALAQNGALDGLVQYFHGQVLLLCEAITRLKQPEFRSPNGFKKVAQGETMIHQGDEPDNVFIIVDGHAEAFVDGLKVGDVPKDEIFGAMAVFTGEKRTATVIAATPCTLMVIPKDQFLAMMQSNPRIAHSLIESMAKRIDLLNRQITQGTTRTPPAKKNEENA